jgi:diacylglycerol O-acyltransferase / wax synthase
MTRHVALGGVDVFHLMTDRAMRSRGLPGNHCAYVLALGGRLDVDLLARRVERACRDLDELRFRLETPLAGAPRWRVAAPAGAPAIEVHALGERSLLGHVEELLARRLDGGRPWAFDVVHDREPDAGALVFRWFHPLTDAKGAERFLRWLGSGTADVSEPPPPPEGRYATSERPIAALDRKARLALLEAYKAHSLALGRTPILSLATARDGARPLGATRALRVELSVEETRAFDLRVRKLAKLAETSLMVIASARLVDRVCCARGYAPPRYVVPLPLSIDPKADAGRMFGNHLAMMLFALDREVLFDDARAVASLADQQRTIVRERLDQAMAVALDYARHLPLAAYRWLLGRPFGGEMGSLVLSNLGAVSIESFLGLPVTAAYAFPTVVVPPGLQVIWSRFRGRLGALIVYVEGVLSAAGAEELGGALRRELLGEKDLAGPASRALL